MQYKIKTVGNSICKEVSFFADSYDLKFSCDNKFPTILNSNKIRFDVNFPKDSMAIKKTSKGYVIVNINDLLNVLQKIKFNPIFFQFKQRLNNYERILNLKANKFEKTKENLKKKTDKKHFDEIIRNLSKVKLLEIELKAAYKETSDKYFSIIEQNYLNKIEQLLNKIEQEHKSESLYGFFLKGKINKSKYYYEQAKYDYNFALKYFDEIHKSFNVTDIKLKSNYKEIVYINVQKIINDLETQFISKNVLKIGTIIYNVGEENFISVKRNWSNLSNIGFEGSFTLKFKNNMQFDILSQAVYVNGYIVSSHYRFPTTFHNVIFANGNTKKKVSESDMIKYFKI